MAKRGLIIAAVLALALGLGGCASPPLHMAALNGDLREVKRLLEGGTDVNSHDSIKTTPLQYAASAGKTEAVKLLLARGAKINSRNQLGLTALHWAAGNGKSETAKLLLANGADLSAGDKYGKTAEDFAREKFHTALASYLAAEQALLAATIARPARPPVAAVAPVAARAEKPQAAVAPLAVLGKISEVQQRVVFTSLESYLSTSYQLISAEVFRQAQETAYSELNLEQCTEEQCIRKIQEILQVERLFVLQVLREEAFTQLSLTLVRLEPGSSLIPEQRAQGDLSF